jgi:hypothetical protein
MNKFNINRIYTNNHYYKKVFDAIIMTIFLNNNFKDLIQI